MAALIAFLVFVIIYIFAYYIISVYQGSSKNMEMRLKAAEDTVAQKRTESVMEQSFSERFLIPLAGRYAGTFKGLTPAGATRYIENRMMMAGGIAGLSAEQFITLIGILVTVLVLISIAISLFFKLSLVKMVGFAVIFGLLLPLLILSRKMAARQESIQRSLPDVLDLVTVSVEAGLGFDGALAKLAEKMKGTLVAEFSRVLQEMRMGVSRKDALKAMGERCGNRDLSLFITALIQADHLGVSMGSVLRVQSVGIRRNRRNQIEQKATKAPIKMLFPLVACIFPTIFIVVLGPAALQIYTLLTPG
ncbi:MAG: Type secretion system domain protein [Firmicutes bacterium]|nr:Type secretion system domain protein [Bacillota bacterium]